MVLINHTNHSSNKWTEAQKAGFSKIIDVPFPNIDPKWSMEEVKELVDKTVNTLNNIREENNLNNEIVNICLQGEFSYCYILFKKLFTNHYYSTEVLIPTTERKVVENGDTKTVTFEFVRWRKTY